MATKTGPAGQERLGDDAVIVYELTETPMLPGGLTYFQQESTNMLNLQSVGYMCTSPDGNCMFNGVSQRLSGMSAAAICCVQPGNGEDRQAELRSMVVGALLSDVELQAVLQQDPQAIERK